MQQRGDWRLENESGGPLQEKDPSVDIFGKYTKSEKVTNKQ